MTQLRFCGEVEGQYTVVTVEGRQIHISIGGTEFRVEWEKTPQSVDAVCSMISHYSSSGVVAAGVFEMTIVVMFLSMMEVTAYTSNLKDDLETFLRDVDRFYLRDELPVRSAMMIPLGVS